MKIAFGSYTWTASDPADNRTITIAAGWGQPDVVIVKRQSSSVGYIRTSSMSGDISKGMVATDWSGNNIQNLTDTDGFEVGSSVTVNNHTLFNNWRYMAIQDDGADDIDVNSYAGDNNDHRTVNLTAGKTWTPDMVIIICASGAVNVFSTADMTDSMDFNSVTEVSQIYSLDAGGFTVSSQVEVNSSGLTYHYIALRQSDSVFKILNYQGNATDDRSITGAGFDPEAAWVAGDTATANRMIYKHPSHTGGTTGTSFTFNTDFEFANKIQQVITDGIQVGTDVTVNELLSYVKKIAGVTIAGTLKIAGLAKASVEKVSGVDNIIPTNYYGCFWKSGSGTPP